MDHPFSRHQTSPGTRFPQEQYNKPTRIRHIHRPIDFERICALLQARGQNIRDNLRFTTTASIRIGQIHIRRRRAVLHNPTSANAENQLISERTYDPALYSLGWQPVSVFADPGYML